MTESVNGKYGQASVGMHRVVLSIACRDADLHDNADARLVDTAVIGWLGQAEALAGLAVGAAIRPDLPELQHLRASPPA